VRSTWQ